MAGSWDARVLPASADFQPKATVGDIRSRITLLRVPTGAAFEHFTRKEDGVTDEPFET